MFAPQKLDYHWVETGHIQTEYFVRAISWNLEGTRLLLGGRLVQLWHSKSSNNADNQEEAYGKPRHGATFQVGNDVDSDDDVKTPEVNKSSASAPKSDSSIKSPTALAGGMLLTIES